MENPWRMDLTEIRKLFNLFAHMFLKQSYPYRAITNTEDVSNEPKAVDVTTGEGLTAIQRRNEGLQKFCLLITISDSLALWFSNNDSLAWKTMVPRVTDGTWRDGIRPFAISFGTHSSAVKSAFRPLLDEFRRSVVRLRIDINPPDKDQTIATLWEDTRLYININAPDKDQTIATVWKNARVSSRLFGQPTWTAIIAFDPG